jgi:O-acetyl-ADP-ribose deacetylase (regulator of RNase III)/anti-sigma regulatory factor (Ser/Thr protein kinase)
MHMERKIGERVIKLVKGDITALEVEAFVFDITADCKLGSGYGGAIAQRGGKAVQTELDKVGKLPTGAAVLTTAGEMKAKHIIHTNGPKFNEPGTEEKLRKATAASLSLAREKGLTQLALPPIGTGLYQVPLDLCARVMIDTVTTHLRGETSLKEVLFVALDQREYTPLELAPDAGSLPADTMAVRAMLQNLLENSLDASRADGESGKGAHWIKLAVRREPPYMLFDLEDNGVGMDRETREKVFSLFFSSKGLKGTGLGLFISNKIVDKHGGHIEVESEPGQGTRFRVHLPLEARPSMPPEG